MSTRQTVTVLNLFFIIALVVANPVNAQVSTTFDSDLELWNVTGDNSSAWESATGNPGGCLAVNDLATGGMNYVIAPPVYHGNWSGMTGSDTLSVDIFHSSSDPDDIMPNFIFRLSGPDGTARALIGESYFPVSDIWNTYVVSLDSAEWTVDEGTWTGLLEAVNSFSIMGEFTDGQETARIDNVYLSATPSYVWIPCAYDDFNTPGTGDWSFSQTGGISNPDIGGNGGGYVRVADGSGISHAIAPAKFLGNWSSLDSHGYVTIDLRVITGTETPLAISEFIRISGPGGSAYVDMDPADLPESSVVWKTFSYPLNTATWTLDSGTWSGLLSYVAECMITVEFFDGIEDIGFDNFGRLENNCPPIYNPIQLYDPTAGDCGFYSFVGIAGIALNPLDEEIYGTIYETTSLGGGIYPVTGADTGILLQPFSRPGDLLFDIDGDAYISEPYDGVINKQEWGGTPSVWVSGFHSGDDDVLGMTFSPAGFDGPNVNPGDILVSDFGSTNALDEIWAFSPDTPEGELQVMADPGSTELEIFDIAAGLNDTVYLCDSFDADNLYELDAQGTRTAIPLSMPVGNMVSIAHDPVDDVVYVASDTGHAVYRIVPSTGNVTLIADGFGTLFRCGIELDSVNRSLWVADIGDGRVYEICLSSPCIHSGDVNGDGSITAADAQMAFYITLSMITPTVTEECAADCDGDGNVTAGDAQQIFYVIFGSEFCVDPIV